MPKFTADENIESVWMFDKKQMFMLYFTLIPSPNVKQRYWQHCHKKMSENCLNGDIAEWY